MNIMSKILLLVTAVSSVVATQGPWQQCGGINFYGGTTCVSGYYCHFQNPYYSQCIPGTAAGSPTKAASKATTTAAATKSAVAKPTVGSISPPPSSNGGVSYKASFTEYGSTDAWGSGNCNVATTACGFFTSSGYSAAVSQNLYGVGPGAGAGPACGSCWKLTIETDSSGKALPNAGNSIVVQVTNLCPAAGNPLCAQNGLSGANQYGAAVNFDTCIDSKASAALFGNSGVGLGLGTAVEVSCSEWSGKVFH